MLLVLFFPHAFVTANFFSPPACLSAGPSNVVLPLPPACLLSPSVRGDLAPCRHPSHSVICCWWLWRIRGSGPCGSLFVWAMCSRSLQSWQKSFMAKHILCLVPHLHTNHSCSFTFPVLGRCRCTGGKFARLPSARRVPCVCVGMRALVCVLKPSSEHVKSSCGGWMLLVPVGTRELQTESRADSVRKLGENFNGKHRN